MESYWYAVLHEVINKNDPEYYFRYTSVADQQGDGVIVRRRHREKKDLTKKYYLGKPYEPIYFTQREFDCVSGLLHGQTVKEVAAALKLSPRTVEYYVKNMKVKLDCYSRSELLSKVIKADLFTRILMDK